jgi:hypothetical protein
VDIAFRDAAGHLLGAYAEYLQVVRPRLDVRLGLSQQRVRPGDALKARVENFGTKEIGYGRGYVLERQERDRWVKFLQRKGFASQSVAFAGVAGRCRGVPIPSTAPGGRYRVRMSVQPLTASNKERIALTATFRVLGEK